MGKKSACKQESWVQSLGQDDPLQREWLLKYSYLGNPMDRGAWQATVHEITKSWTRRSDYGSPEMYHRLFRGL